MENIKNYAEIIKQRLEKKQASLDNYITKYRDLMSKSDTDIRIANSNETVLKNDLVYNSPLANEELRKAIETRSLNGMSQEEFLDNYKAVLNGIDLNKNEETGLVKITNEASLDIVPTKIDITTLKKAEGIEEKGSKAKKYTENYLVRICQENDLTLRDLNEIIDMRNAYDTKIENLVKWKKQGYSLEEISQVLEARDQLANSYSEGKLSFPQIIEFANKFNLEIDQGVLTDKLSEVYDTCNQLPDIDYPVDCVLKAPNSELEPALNWVSQNSKSQNKNYGIERFNFNNRSIAGLTSLDELYEKEE